MSSETPITATADAIFIDNQTWLSQSNWQSFFSSSTPSGVLIERGLTIAGTEFNRDFMPHSVGSGNYELDGGTAYIKGIKITVGQSGSFSVSAYDDFIVLRINFSSGEASIIQKTGLATDYYPDSQADRNNFWQKFVASESFSCTRTSTVYEIPLWYFGAGGRYDLRRLYYVNRPDTINYSYIGSGVTLVGGVNYKITLPSDFTSARAIISPSLVNSEKPSTITVINNSYDSVNISLPLGRYNYFWASSWGQETVNGVTYIYKTLGVGEEMTFRLIPIGWEADGSKVNYIVQTE